jgi:preflagellin peptidase FlaK
MIFTLLALSGAVVASYTDLKHGIIHNKLTLGLFAVGFFGHLILDGMKLLLPLLTGIVLIFILGYGFWVVGGWSAGDAKEFLFLAALLPNYPQEFSNYLGLNSPVLGPYPFVVTIFLNTILAIFPFILLWGIYTSIKKAKLSELFEPLQKLKEIGLSAAVFTAAILATALMGVTAVLAIPLVLVSYRLSDRVKIGVSATIALAFIIRTFDVLGVLKNFSTIFLAFLLFKLFWNSIKIVREIALKETVNVGDLKEGMVPSEAIYIGENKIETRAGGLTMEEIDKLKQHKKEGRLEKITVKKTTPFAPVILIGLLISLTIGDIIMAVSNG